ncbi:ATP-dependent Clp protease ATP-binding subunit CLPT2, chloroplastic-like protein [Drosera capensis]
MGLGDKAMFSDPSGAYFLGLPLFFFTAAAPAAAPGGTTATSGADPPSWNMERVSDGQVPNLASRFLRGHGVTHTKILGDVGISDYTTRLRIPFTVAVQKALDWAVNEKLKAGGSGMITTSDLLLGIWFSGESPGHTILVNLGFDAEKAEQLKYLSSQPGYDEW